MASSRTSEGEKSRCMLPSIVSKKRNGSAVKGQPTFSRTGKSLVCSLGTASGVAVSLFYLILWQDESWVGPR